MSHTSTTDSKLPIIKIVLGILIVLGLLFAIWFAQRSDAVETPTETTTETRPDPQQAVDQDHDGVIRPGDQTTPDPNGSGGNTMLAPSVEPN